MIYTENSEFPGNEVLQPLRHLLASMADAMNGFGEITRHSDALGNGSQQISAPK